MKPPGDSEDSQHREMGRCLTRQGRRRKFVADILHARYRTIQGLLDFLIQRLLLGVLLPAALLSRPIIPDSTSDNPGEASSTLQRSLFLRFPFRTLNEYLGLLPGVVSVNGDLHFRGTRTGEVSYFLNDFAVTNPFFNSLGVPIIPEAIDELQVHTGVYEPTLGSANGGAVIAEMRTGGEQLAVSVDYQGDEFLRPGKEFLKTTAQGYRTIVGTIGGPVLVPSVKFFVAGQHHYMRNRQPMFLEPFSYDSLRTDPWSYSGGMLLPGPVRFGKNYLPDNWFLANVVQGNVVVELPPITITAIGSFSGEKYPVETSWPERLRNVFRLRRSPLSETTTRFSGLKVSVKLSTETEIQASASIYNRFARQFDPDFGDEWQLYADSVANARRGYNGFESRYYARPSYSTAFGFMINYPDAPNNSYEKNRQAGTTVNLTVKHRLSPFWSVTAGWSYEKWSVRFYRFPYVSAYLGYIDKDRDGIQDTWFTDDEHAKLVLRWYGFSSYGYNYSGAELDDGIDRAMEPTFTSLSLDNEIADEGITLRLGGLYKSFSSDILTARNYTSPPSGPEYYKYNRYILPEKDLGRQAPVRLFLPRARLEVQLSEKTMMHIGYGRFAQYADLRSLYLGRIELSELISPDWRRGYWLGGPMVTSFAQPERSTMYEAGVVYRPSSAGSVGVRLYQKFMKNQLEPGRVYDERGNAIFVALQNKGQAQARGLELSAHLNVSQALAFVLFYSLSHAEGTSSATFGLRRELSGEVLPPLPFRLDPLEYDQRHRGAFIATMQFSESSDPILGGVSLAGVVSFNSGHRYTRIQTPRYVGGFGPYSVAVRPLVDPAGHPTLEPVNASTTPWVFNIDLHVGKEISLSLVKAEFYVNVLNLLGRKHVLNVYPTTGTPTDDGWLTSPGAEYLIQQELYENFYRTINLQNRWAYMSATGNDIYGTPRQIRLGVRVVM